MIKWHHIMDQQPVNGSSIIQLDPMYEGRYETIGFRIWDLRMSFQEYIKYNTEKDLPLPNFYWMYYKNFPFPNHQNFYLVSA